MTLERICGVLKTQILYVLECCYGQNGLRGAGTRQRVQDKERDMTKSHAKPRVLESL